MLAELTQVVISNAWVTVIVGVLLPLVTAVLVKAGASTKVRAAAAILISGVAAVLTQLVVDGADAVLTWETARQFLLLYGVQFMTYLGFWKPVVEVQAKVLPEVGIG